MPVILNERCAPGIYLGLSTGKLLWIAGEPRRGVIHIEEGFEGGGLTNFNGGALFWGAVEVLLDPASAREYNVDAVPGNLVIGSGQLNLVIPDRPNLRGITRLLPLGPHPVASDFPYAAQFSRWGLRLKDVDGDWLMPFEVNTALR